MSSKIFEELCQLNDMSLHQGADPSLIAKLRNSLNFALPIFHEEVLKWSNGVEVYGGYMRLFGTDSNDTVDCILWNHFDTWKFAWGNRCSNYWCFAETAWGDQYAYSLDSMRSRGDLSVYLLDALSMTPRFVGSSFTEFLEKEFIPSAKMPYDAMTVQGRQKFGLLAVNEHLVHVPSILLGGTEEINNVQKMNARSAMIFNGDIATQLDAGPSKGVIKAVQPYEDELNRMRLRLVWS